MSLVERRGLVDDLVVGISSRWFHNGSEWDCCLVRAGILVGFLLVCDGVHGFGLEMLWV